MQIPSHFASNSLFNKQFYLACINFLRQNKDILLIPIVALVLFFSLVGAALAIGFQELRVMLDSGLNFIIGAVGILVLYLIAGFIVIASHAMLFDVIYQRFSNPDYRIQQAVEKIFNRWPKMLAWSVIQSTLGLIFHALENLHGVLKQVMVWMLSISWGVATFFVIPIMVVENTGPISAIKQSSHLLKNHGRQFFRRMLPLVGFFILLVIIFAMAALSIVLTGKMLSLIYVGALAFVGIVLNATISRTFYIIAEAALYRQLATAEAEINK